MRSLLSHHTRQVSSSQLFRGTQAPRRCVRQHDPFEARKPGVQGRVRASGRWAAQYAAKPAPPTLPAIGIDPCVAVFVAPSNGTPIAPLNAGKEALASPEEWASQRRGERLHLPAHTVRRGHSASPSIACRAMLVERSCRPSGRVRMKSMEHQAGVRPDEKLCRLLGVSASDDLTTITRAYRRLAKQFHPDVSGLPRPIAEEQFKTIAEAYRAIRAAKTSGSFPTPFAYSEEVQNPASAARDQLSETELWSGFCARVPRAARLHDELSKISAAAAKEFQRAALHDNSPDWLEEIAILLEEEYLRRHFGPDLDVCLFAKWLIRNGYRSIAVTLNRTLISEGLPRDFRKVLT